MSTARFVPVTREELEGEEALETLRSTGRRRLVADAVMRFRAADGFSHSRALGFQITLTLLPALIAIVGLAEALDQPSARRAVQGTIETLAPGASGELLTEALSQGSTAATRETGERALVGGLLAAIVAGATAMAQVERGANRIYGTERDRPFLRKYGVAVLLTVTAGLVMALSVVVLVAGHEVRGAFDLPDPADDALRVLRWPLGLGLVVVGVSLLFARAPRRRQPEPSWLAVGAVLSALLFLVFMGILALYVDATDAFGATYGPLAGTIGMLLWSFAVSVALFLGLAFAAQLEAIRAGVPEPRVEWEHPESEAR